ncbi:hypothetical protein GCM10009118_31160 [Wandonia haliotis]|uniref:DUF3037 domain-containing protein n=1 Tax=Wandonia haliotis TaxID=574963 RepID=A0ABN1MTP8_9FLAO
MSKSFSYSILTYKHSLFLGEVLNVGILLIFPDDHLIEFRYPKKINRIKNLYADFNEALIKEYLKGFESKTRNLHNKLDKYVFGYHDLISENLLVEDASALQFESFRSGIYYTTPEEVIKRYTDLVLGDYNSDTIGTRHRITEDSLIQNIKSKIIELNPSSKSHLKFDENRILKNKHIAFKSDFYWKNGVVNYAKAVSFDVAKEATIIDKSILINGKLRQLEKTSYKNAHIDFIIQEPLNADFNDAVEEAKSILRENRIEKRIFTNWNEYSVLVANDIKQF